MTFSLEGKRVLITGGSGTWGREFARQLLAGAKACDISIYSRSEYRQVEVRRLFQQWSNVHYVIGDIRDLERLKAVTRGVQVIIHLAALKHVPVVEENPREALATNTIGTQNVIDAAQANDVERVLYVSSDKAVDPLNFYGVTKLAAERLIVAANQNERAPRFITYRAGNVVGSDGSAIPIFQNELIHQNMISLTDARMTRFFFSCQDAVQLALVSLKKGLGGEIFIPEMKSTTLDLLARIMIKHLGKEDTAVRRIGIRPGEKFSELLISRNESSRTKKVGMMWVVLPFFPGPELVKEYEAAPSVTFTEYASDTAEQFSWDDLESLLQQEGFLCRQPTSHVSMYFRKDQWDFH
jgi:UDP-N-acetylglucosamine 4,6-dehydratase/5-epimerase